MRKDQYIVALEIGSSKIIGAVAKRAADNQHLSLLGIEEERATDLVRYGCIQNIEEVYNLVVKVIRKLENRAAVSPRKIKSIFVGIGGRSMRAVQQEADITFNEPTQITDDNIRSLKNQVRREQFQGFDVLSTVPRRYVVDKTESKQPVGTIANHFSATFNLIVARQQLKSNLRRVLEEKLQMNVRSYIVTPIAIAREAMTSEERNLGCMLVDFGAETTTVAIYRGNVLVYLFDMPLGSRTITRDITTLNILEEKAEELKKTMGNALPGAQTGSTLSVDGISVADASNYIVARTGEIVENIVQQVSNAGLDLSSDLPAGIVLVGGGAKLNGLEQVLAERTKLKIRKGTASRNIDLLESREQGLEYVSILSLLLEGANRLPADDSCCESIQETRTTTPEQDAEAQRKAELEEAAKREAEAAAAKKSSRGGWFKRTTEFLKAKSANIFEDDDE